MNSLKKIAAINSFIYFRSNLNNKHMSHIYRFFTKHTYAVFFGVLLLGVSCSNTPDKPLNQVEKVFAIADGTYRGSFSDAGKFEVHVQFSIQNYIITEARFRYLYGKDDFVLGITKDPFKSVVQQYHEALQHLVGKDIRVHLEDLYYPGNIVTTKIDGFSGATIRANKIISAIRDALIRGVYQP